MPIPDHDNGDGFRDEERITRFSDDRVYRYTLWRDWFDDLFDHGAYAAPKPRFVMFIGLNPSTADETKDDPTIRKCIGFAKRWGYSALCMTNLFAFRATDPRKMMGYSKPVGPDNDRWLAATAREADRIIAAWGTKGEFMGRAEEVLKLLHNVECLRKTGQGFPEHPLYVPYETRPIEYGN